MMKRICKLIYFFISFMMMATVSIGVTNENDMIVLAEASVEQIEIITEEPEAIKKNQEAEEETVKIDEKGSEPVVEEKPVYIPQGPKTVNFDSYIAFVNNNEDQTGETTQQYLDQGYIVRYNGNYLHHNYGKFLELFNSIKEGDTVIIGGQTYTAVFKEYARVSDDFYHIYGNETGIDHHGTSTIDIITCYGSVGSMDRVVWVIE